MIRVSTTIQSHLSDTLMEISFLPKQADRRIRFVKYLIGRFGDDLEQFVNIDQVYEEFCNSRFYQ